MRREFLHTGGEISNSFNECTLPYFLRSGSITKFVALKLAVRVVIRPFELSKHATMKAALHFCTKQGSSFTPAGLPTPMWRSYSGNKMLRKQRWLLQRPGLRPWCKRAGNRGEKRPGTTSLRDHMTVWEAAEYLRLSTATVYKLLRTGRLHGVKTKRDWRVSRAAVLALGDDRSRSTSQLGRKRGFL